MGISVIHTVVMCITPSGFNVNEKIHDGNNALSRVMIIQFSLLMKYFIHLHIHKLCIIRHNVTYNYFRNVLKLQVIGHWGVRGFLGGIRSQKALKVPQNIIEPFSKYEIFIT